MKNFLAIMNWGGDNRVAKYQDFDTEAEAVDHTVLHSAKFPNAFIVTKPNSSFASWLVNPLAKTLSIDFPVIVPPTDAERVDAAFSSGDKDQIIKAVFLDFENRIRVLEGKEVATDILTSLKDKLPQGMP